MLRRIAIFLIVALIFIAMLVFTYHNKNTVDVHLVFTEVSVPVSLAFTVTFALGWLFGVVSMGLYAFRLAREKRSLKRSLTVSEQEVSSLRNLPLADAD